MDRIDYYILLETRKATVVLDFIEYCKRNFFIIHSGTYDSPFCQEEMTLEQLLIYLENNVNESFNLYWNNEMKESFLIIISAMFTEDKHLILGIYCFFNRRTIKKLKKMIQELNLMFEPKAYLFWGEDLPPQDSVSFINCAENSGMTVERFFAENSSCPLDLLLNFFHYKNSKYRY